MFLPELYFRSPLRFRLRSRFFLFTAAGQQRAAYEQQGKQGPEIRQAGKRGYSHGRMWGGGFVGD